jgi:putative ABC transport system ATP-binding protein
MNTDVRNVIELDQVRFGWSTGSALLVIDHLTVGDGERVFIHGSSGSGKSTLLGLIAGIHLPESGTIRIFDHDLGSMSAGARDRLRGAELGFVFQQFNLVPYLSVLDNVRLPLTFSRERRNRCGSAAASLGLALDLLEHLGLDDEFTRRQPNELSVGQQQRVAVARALLGRPRLVICDEPTSALDADARSGFLDVLLAESERAGSAVLFVSHDMALASHFDRAVDMRSFRRDQ